MAAAARPLLRLLVVGGCVVTLFELWLLGHTDGFWQRLPLAVLAVGLIAFAAEAVRPGARTRRALQIVMAAFVLCGLVGLGQHYSGNREFELEMYPTRHGLELFWETLRGATPALAPTAMAHLGLLGLLYCHLSSSEDRGSP
jgi:hypothetical protein